MESAHAACVSTVDTYARRNAHCLPVFLLEEFGLGRNAHCLPVFLLEEFGLGLAPLGLGWPVITLGVVLVFALDATVCTFLA